MDRLTGMRVFVHVVELGAFRAAAEAMGMSTTMVSNHVQALERRLGTRLLNRTTRRLSLTEIGSTYFANCVDVLQRIDEAEALAKDMQARPKGRLRVAAPVGLGSELLIEALADFLREHNEIEIDLQLVDRAVDVTEDGLDAVFRVGPPPDGALAVRPLLRSRRIVCAAPEYLERAGTPQDLLELERHNCLTLHRLRPGTEWTFLGEQPENLHVKGQLAVNSGHALRRAAIAGIGIAALPEYLVSEDLREGRLRRLFPERELWSDPVHLVYLPDRQMTPKLRTFVEFIVRRLGIPEAMAAVAS